MERLKSRKYETPVIASANVGRIISDCQENISVFKSKNSLSKGDMFILNICVNELKSQGFTFVSSRLKNVIGTFKNYDLPCGEHPTEKNIVIVTVEG